MEAWRLPEIGTRETVLNKSSDSMQEQNQSWPFSCPQIIEKFPCAESGALWDEKSRDTLASRVVY